MKMKGSRSESSNVHGMHFMSHCAVRPYHFGFVNIQDEFKRRTSALTFWQFLHIFTALGTIGMSSERIPRYQKETIIFAKPLHGFHSTNCNLLFIIIHIHESWELILIFQFYIGGNYFVETHRAAFVHSLYSVRFAIRWFHNIILNCF